MGLEESGGLPEQYIAALCSTVVLAVMVLGTSLITANIMDTVFKPLMETGQVTEEARQRLIVLVAVLIGYTLLRTTMAYFSVITYETCSQKLVYKLRKRLVPEHAGAGPGFLFTEPHGDLMTRLTGDMDMVRFMVAWIIRQLIDCTVLFLTTSICFLVTDWLFALSLLVVTPVIFLLTKRFCQAGAAPLCGPAERLSQLNTSAQENISGNRVVKAFARENYEIAKFDEKNEAYKTANTKASLLWLKFSPYIDRVSQSLAIAVLLVGGIFLIWGRISIGTFTLLIPSAGRSPTPCACWGCISMTCSAFLPAPTRLLSSIIQNPPSLPVQMQKRWKED